MLETDELELERAADIRFAGQGYDVVTPLPAGPLTVDVVESAFRSAYVVRYGNNLPDLPAEFVTVRLAARADLGSLPLRSPSAKPSGAAPRSRPVYDTVAGRTGAWDVLKLTALISTPRPGPCIVELGDTTLVIPAGWFARLDENAAVIAERVATYA
jgi:N-methylhydantoinase A